MDFSVHDCADIVFELHMPDNANCTLFSIKRKGGENINLTFFDFPSEVVERLVNAFGPPKRTRIKSSNDNMKQDRPEAHSNTDPDAQF
jgi:hypothetical protein